MVYGTDIFFVLSGCLLQRISSDQGIPESRQILSIQAGPQRLNDGASLIGCCNVGGEVNQPSGWSELHLELNVKNFSFSPTNPLMVRNVYDFVFC